MQATGGGWVSGINPPNYYGDPVSGSFILPVRKGASWQVGVIQPWVSIPLPPIAFYWIPLGVGSAGGGAKAAAREDFAASPSAPAVAPRGLPFQFSGQARLAQGRAIVKFGDAIPAPANAADGPSYCVLLTPTERCGGPGMVLWSKSLPVGKVMLASIGSLSRNKPLWLARKW